MSLTLFINGTCPRCGKPLKLSVIEAHPTSRHFAIHNYQCIDCGPVLAKVRSPMLFSDAAMTAAER
jgi:phage FluMu protein Com